MSETNGQQLPTGWGCSTLGQVCDSSQYGWTTSARKEGLLPLLRTTDISSGEVDWSSVPFCEQEPDDVEKYVLKDNDLLISRAGSVGKSFLINKPPRAVFASYLIRFRSLIDPKFTHYYLQSAAYWRQISQFTAG